MTPSGGNWLPAETAPAVVAVACTTLRHARRLSVGGVHPVLPAAHSTLFSHTALRNRSSCVCSVAVVPPCSAAGRVLLPPGAENDDPAPEHAFTTFFESGVPVMVNTTTVLA